MFSYRAGLLQTRAAKRAENQFNREYEHRLESNAGERIRRARQLSGSKPEEHRSHEHPYVGGKQALPLETPAPSPCQDRHRGPRNKAREQDNRKSLLEDIENLPMLVNRDANVRGDDGSKCLKHYGRSRCFFRTRLLHWCSPREASYTYAVCRDPPSFQTARPLLFLHRQIVRINILRWTPAPPSPIMKSLRKPAQQPVPRS